MSLASITAKMSRTSALSIAFYVSAIILVLSCGGYARATYLDNVGATKVDELTDGRSNDSTYLYLGQNAGGVSVGDYSTGIGVNALDAATSGHSNTAVGYDVLTNILNGDFNVAVGYNSMLSLIAGDDNTAVGTSALQFNVSGFDNTAIGRESSRHITGSRNTSVGNFALYGALGTATGSDNVAIGEKSAESISSGSQNTVIGSESLSSSTVGEHNTSLGYYSLRVATGNNNTSLGWSAGSAISTGSGNIAIGYDADVASETGDNQLSLGNLIYGSDLDGRGINISTGKIGIGIKDPDYDVHFYRDSGDSTLAIQAETGDVDPTVKFVGNVTDIWSIGLDDSDGDKLKISDDAALGTNDRLVISETGFVGINESNPAVSLHASAATDTDVLRVQDSDGTCDLNPGSGASWSCTSDARLKNKYCGCDWNT